MKINTTFTPEPMPLHVREATDQGIKQFLSAACGLTAHWGLYSVLAGHEWAYFNDRIPLVSYRPLMQRFNPQRFNADEWADLLLEAGMKFFMITSKHHDGFCLWDSKLTDFKVTNSAFKRDVIAEIAVALQDRGIALHFYYSLVDWIYPAYRTDWAAYVAYYQGQIRELCTQYGPIAGILFDGYWPRQEFEGDEIDYFSARGHWDLATTYQMIHDLQPDAVITNNTHIAPLPGEDYQVSELDLPGENTQGFNTLEKGHKPLASWFNINTGWSYQPRHHRVMPLEQMMTYYRKMQEQNAVFMLNVGPRPFGDIHPDEQMVLRQFGRAVR